MNNPIAPQKGRKTSKTSNVTSENSPALFLILSIQYFLLPLFPRHSSASEKEDENVSVTVVEPVCLTFALRYLNNFAKATSLSPCVRIGLSKDVPVLVEYLVGDLGHMRFFLAPKIEEDDEVKMEGDD